VHRLAHVIVGIVQVDDVEGADDPQVDLWRAQSQLGAET
jgi:hypothetical protein